MNSITSALVSDVTSVYAYFTFSYGQKKQLSPGPPRVLVVRFVLRLNQKV